MKKKLPCTIWPALIWSVIICILLIIPGQDFPEGPRVPSLDKIIHVFLFGVQVFLWCRYINRTYRVPVWIFLLVFLISCIYGIVMEYVQHYWVSNRSFEMEDIWADIAGSAAGWLMYYYCFPGKKRTV
ncbi:MAG TPA: VanZ family protein [Agriterribacter sp.]|nr:VanZ family protein [Agriterribacter sp.]